MAITSTLSSSFKYTNTTAAASKSISLVDMKEVENYALIEDEPNKVQLDNTTAPVDASEVLIYRGKRVDKVNTNLTLPSKTSVVTKGVQYAIQLEGDIVTTDSDDSTFRQDDPVIMYLTVIHPISGFVSDSLLGQHLGRLVSACQKEDGTWRFNELMRLGLKPTED
jgi:hypothetical protein